MIVFQVTPDHDVMLYEIHNNGDIAFAGIFNFFFSNSNFFSLFINMNNASNFRQQPKTKQNKKPKNKKLVNTIRPRETTNGCNRKEAVRSYSNKPNSGPHESLTTKQNPNSKF